MPDEYLTNAVLPWFESHGLPYQSGDLAVLATVATDSGCFAVTVGAISEAALLTICVRAVAVSGHPTPDLLLALKDLNRGGPWKWVLNDGGLAYIADHRITELLTPELFGELFTDCLSEVGHFVPVLSRVVHAGMSLGEALKGARPRRKSRAERQAEQIIRKQFDERAEGS